MRPTTSGSSSTGSSGSGSGGEQDDPATEIAATGGAPSNKGGGAEILPDGSIRNSKGEIKRPGVRAIDLGPDAAGGAGFMDIALGASGGGANGKAYALSNSDFAFYGLRSDTNFPVTAKPAFLKDVNLTYSFDSAGTAFWLDRSNGRLLSPNAPYAMPSKADMEFDAFLSGAGDNLAGLTRGAWDFTKTGVGMFFGDIDSWKRSSVAINRMNDQLSQQTAGSLFTAVGDGIIAASPVGGARSLADGNPYEAGGRFSTVAIGTLGPAAVMPAERFVVGGSALDTDLAFRMRALYSRTGQSTGIAEFDSLFVQSAQAAKMLSALERRGINVIDDVTRL